VDRCAIGLSVHTGWAACVAAGGSLRAPQIDAREEIAILGDADRFVFHRAAKLDLAAAKGSVARAREQALERAAAALGELVARLRAAGHGVVACAIVASGAPMRASLEEILAAHPRIHTAEGCFYRDVLLRAAEANRLPSRIVPPRSLDLDGKALLLADAGRAVGKPWAKDQKLAALAAWTVL
jgi:hypothetical protein